MSKKLLVNRLFLAGLAVSLFVLSLYFWDQRKTLAPVAQHNLPEKPLFKKEPKRAGHPDEYLLYHQSIRTQDGDVRPKYPPNYRVTELLKAYKLNSTGRLSKSQVVDSLPWQEVGPYNVAGRSRVVLPDPSDTTLQTWYVGSASGGIWKTTNRGQNWINLTKNLPNLSTTTLALSPQNPNIIYAGTGEGFSPRLVYGEGLWKSLDSGETWTQLPASATDVRFTNIMRIIVDPADPDHVVIATASGVRNNTFAETSYIFRSTDGGSTWTQTYQSTGDLFDGRIEQVVASPESFAIQYATVHNRGVLKSTDSGQTWEQVFTPPPDIAVGRMELAVAPTDPSRVYVVGEGLPDGAYVFASTDAGNQWFLTRANNGNNIDWFSSQGWYDNTIAVHPYDPTIVYTGGIDLMRITVGPEFGTDITPVTDAYGQYRFVGAKGVHPDHHGITLVPIDSAAGTFLFLDANDGGLSFSLDAGQTFTQTGDTWAQIPGGGGTTSTPLRGLNTSQFYGMDKMNGARRYIGGTQDNGTWVSPFDPAPFSNWQSAPSGDGFEAAWHYGDTDKIIESSQFNVFYRSLNGGISWSFLPVPGASGPFVTRLAKSNQDPDLVFAVDSIGVLISENFGTDWELLQPEGWDEKTARRNIIARISLASPDVIWAGSHLTGDRGLFVSSDRASTFQSTSSFSLNTMGPITGIATHPSDPNTAYALFSYANAPKILRTTDLGQTWEDLSGFGEGPESMNGFPDVATYCLLVMPFDENQIWAGTEIGLFKSNDGGQTWSAAQDGLPAVSIWQMRIVNDEVVLATHGRGIWSVSLPELAGYEPPPVLLSPIITNEATTVDGLITYTLQLREPADSTVIEIDSVPVETLGPNADATELSLSTSLEITETRTVQLRAVSYVNGESARSRSRSLRIVQRFPAQASFTTDFSTRNAPFVLEGFNIEQPEAFPDSALHSRHPYENNSEYIAQLMVPIIVAANNAIVRYEDIALIEEGQFGSQFGDPGFYDYVVLEGSLDGAEWTPLEDGYDASLSNGWVQFYTLGASGNPDLYVPHEVNLLNTFSPGDEVFLRFRLYSDQSITGWGWSIDNLSIQEGVVTNTQDASALPLAFQLEQNYPNPFQSTTTIAYSLSTPSHVSLAVYDMLGRRIALLLDDPMKPAGSYQHQWASGALASGTYHVVLTTAEGTQTRVAVKI